MRNELSNIVELQTVSLSYGWTLTQLFTQFCLVLQMVLRYYFRFDITFCGLLNIQNGVQCP